MTTLKTLLLVAILVVVIGAPLSAQNIDCRVRVSLEKMPLENQEKLSYLRDELDLYINSWDWTDAEYNYDISCQLEIAFDEVKIVGYEDRYTATMIVSNGVDLQYADKRWLFALQPNERLQHSSAFHPFSGFLDFYFYLLLAHEYDKLSRLGGDEYYDKALQVSESAKFSSQYYKGWDRRIDLIQELRKDDNKPYRQCLFHFFNGYAFYEADDRDNAKVHFQRLANQLRRVPEEKRKRFFELNYLQIDKAMEALGLERELALVNSLKVD